MFCPSSRSIMSMRAAVYASKLNVLAYGLNFGIWARHGWDSTPGPFRESEVLFWNKILMSWILIIRERPWVS